VRLSTCGTCSLDSRLRGNDNVGTVVLRFSIASLVALGPLRSCPKACNRNGPNVTLSEAKGLACDEILRYAQNDRRATCSLCQGLLEGSSKDTR
jgi:hypothetical protein